MTLEIDPFQLPYVLFNDLNSLPNCAGIYFALDSESIIHYIGKAENLNKRWKTHHRKFELQIVSQKYPVKITYLVWSKDDLDSAERYFIQQYQPLMNQTKVKYSEIIPSEITLKKLLRTIAKKIVVVGQIKPLSNELTIIYVKYDSSDTTAKGAAAIIRKFKAENKDKCLKIKWQKYGEIWFAESPRIGSREQKTQARIRRAYNNHWKIYCNGVIIDITPEDHEFKSLKEHSITWRLAGIKTQAIVSDDFLYFKNNTYIHFIDQFDKMISIKEFYEITPVERDYDPIPLFWKNWKE